MVDMMTVGTGFGMGAALPVVLFSFLNMEFFILPGLIIGGALGAAFSAGLLDVGF